MNQTAEPTALVVVSHHRADSLTAAVADHVAGLLRDAGYGIDLLNLHDAGFEPRNSQADEPDYDDRDKVYTPEVRRHIARVHAADLVVPVFPVWWYGLPGLLKGWIDRVWNYGVAYGRRDSLMTKKAMLWIGLAGITADDPNADLVDPVLTDILRRGISEYCDVPNTHVAALFDSEGGDRTGPARDDHYREFFAQAEDAVKKLLAGV